MKEEKRKIEPIFILGIILFIFAIFAYTYNSYLDKHIDMQSIIVNEDTSDTISTTSINTLTSSSTFSPPSVQPPAENLTEANNAAACNANTLDGQTSWREISGSLSATTKITNRDSEDCVLYGFPLITLFSGNTALSVANLHSGESSAVTLHALTSAYVHFTWSNWCNSETLSALQSRIYLGENNGYLQIPVIDTKGIPQSNTPQCSSASSQSILSVNSYSGQ